MTTLDLGNQCVWCQQDTTFGSGKFVDRISVYTDSESVEWLTDAQRDQYETVEGYGCAECYEEEEEEKETE
jgi:hypothetical protein